MSREKAYRDPVHDFITLRDPLFLDLIDTPEFQRLRRIRQLGASFGTYHGAEHSRFGHSLGVLWVMTRILERLQHIGVTIEEEWAVVAKAAALLHDVGHGPYSHALEGWLTPGLRHEVWSQRIILGPGPLHDRLYAHDPRLPEMVAAVIGGTLTEPGFITDLVSSQMDVDRMDYLIRDSLYTGVTYGRFDLTRLINTLQVHDDRIVCVAKGIGAVEEYLLARYFMYWQVYLHKTTRSHELMLGRLWLRARDAWQEGGLSAEEVPVTLVPFLEGKPTRDDYLQLDDVDVTFAMKRWQFAADPILADLAQRLLQRRLLKPVFKVPPTSISHERLPDVEAVLKKAGWDPRYYLLVDDVQGVAYDLYAPDEALVINEGPVIGDSPVNDEGPSINKSPDRKDDLAYDRGDDIAQTHATKTPILVMDELGRPREITQLSATMRALAAGPRVAVNVFVPQDVREDVHALLVRR